MRRRHGRRPRDESQQPTWPHVRHMRRRTHRSPSFEHSAHPVETGLTRRTRSRCAHVIMGCANRLLRSSSTAWEGHGQETALHSHSAPSNTARRFEMRHVRVIRPCTRASGDGTVVAQVAARRFP